MRHVLLLFCLLGTLSTVAPPGRAEEPRVLVEKAIKAHGGMEKLLQLTRVHEKTRATMTVDDTTLKLTTDTLIQLPGQFRSTIKATINNRPLDLIQVLDGKKAWTSEDGRIADASEGVLQSYRELLHVQQVATLVPLLAADKGYKLTALPEIQVNGKPALGIKVAFKGRRDVSLYFDKGSGLLVKESYLLHEGGKDFKEEVFLNEYKEYKGLKRASKVVQYRDGKKYLDAEVTSLEFLDRIDAKEFARP